MLSFQKFPVNFNGLLKELTTLPNSETLGVDVTGAMGSTTSKSFNLPANSYSAVIVKSDVLCMWDNLGTFDDIVVDIQLAGVSKKQWQVYGEETATGSLRILEPFEVEFAAPAGGLIEIVLNPSGGDAQNHAQCQNLKVYAKI